MTKSVLFIDEPHPLLADGLSSAGFEVHLAPSAPRAALEHLVADCVGVVVKSRVHIDAEFLDCASDLSFIARVGAGLESIDVDAAAARSISVLNSPEGNRDAVAEHCVGMLLMLMNNLARADREMRQGIWRREANRGHELMGSTVGIVGCGHMGQAFAQRLSGFDVRTVGYDNAITGFGNSFLEEVALDELKASADVVSFHVPWTPANDGFVNATYLAGFAKAPLIINSSRGKNLVLSDLLAALDSGQISGAALDVFEYEGQSFEDVNPATWPETYASLCASDKVVLSPHIAGWTHASSRKHAETLLAKILALPR